MSINKNGIQIISVGDNFELFTGRNMKDQDGGIFEVMEDGKFAFMIYLNHMTRTERLLLKEAIIKVHRLKDADHLLKFLIRYGSSNLIFEISFNPHLYKDYKKEKLFSSNMLYIFGIESSNNTVQTIRYANMPRQMYLGLLSQYELSKGIKNYNDKYNRWLDDLEKRYTIHQLWDLSTYVGKIGE